MSVPAVQLYEGHERPLPALLRPIAKPAEVLNAQEATRALIAETLTPNRDYGLIPGTQKPSLLKPGAERVALAFGCYYGEPEIAEKEVDHDRIVHWKKRHKEWSGPKGNRTFTWKVNEGESIGLYRYVVRVPVINRANGERVGYGIGACSSMEPKYIEDPRAVENTMLKMARKRAIIDAALTTFGLSDQFTQDVEDLDGGGAPPREAAAESAQRESAPTQTSDPTKITLEEALGHVVNNQTLGNVRNDGLRKIRNWANKKIEEKGETDALVRAACACTLILEAREQGKIQEPAKSDPQGVAADPAPAAKSAANAATSASAAPGADKIGKAANAATPGTSSPTDRGEAWEDGEGSLGELPGGV